MGQTFWSLQQHVGASQCCKIGQMIFTESIHLGRRMGIMVCGGLPCIHASLEGTSSISSAQPFLWYLAMEGVKARWDWGGCLRLPLHWFRRRKVRNQLARCTGYGR